MMYKISFIYEKGRGEQGNCYSYRDFVYLFFLLLFQDAKEAKRVSFVIYVAFSKRKKVYKVMLSNTVNYVIRFSPFS